LNIVAVLKTGQDQKSAGTHALHPLLLVQQSCDRPMEEFVTRFYARFRHKTARCDWQIGYLFGNQFRISANWLARSVRLLLPLHDVREGDYSSLAEIRTLSAVDSIPSLLRVL